MSDTLVVTISQSGTTADTNRTVDLVRARGAAVIGIVNRRQSDLVDKSDGVLYTSDGRDLEMSVASTKAFYAQIAAGFLLAFAIATGARRRHRRGATAPPATRSSPRCASCPTRCARCSSGARRSRSPRSGTRSSRRSWAVVGNGINRVAAEEIRIKLSELCYKSISCDITEDKKHIDLSAEPMIVVCAAGLHGSNADDVGKEIAIYRAHKSAPIVIADDGEERFLAALETLERSGRAPRPVASCCARWSGTCSATKPRSPSTRTARPLREARGRIEALHRSRRSRATSCCARSPVELQPHADRFFDGLRTSSYDGALDAGTAVRLASLLRYATGVVPLDVYQVEFGKVGTPSTLIEDLNARAHEGDRGADPPDRRDQAPGEDRHRRHLALRRDAAAGAARAGTARDRRRARQPHVPRACARWSRSIPRSMRSSGWTRYRIDGDPSRPGATIEVVDTGGIARDIPSRTADNPTLRGTKHRAASEREVTVVRGRADGRTLVIVPEIKANQTTGLTLLHVRFHDRLPAEAARRVLEGYRDRYEAIADQVTEVEPVMRDDVLGTIDLVELLTEPVVRLADRWRSAPSRRSGKRSCAGNSRRLLRWPVPPRTGPGGAQWSGATGPDPGRDGRRRPAGDRGRDARTVLIERAARAVARAVQMLGGSYGRRVVIACGKGNNGADGRVAAGILRHAASASTSSPLATT